MRTFRLSMLLLIGMAVSVFAIDAESLIRSGNTFYEQGEYGKAVREYEKILAADQHSAILHYNLGSAYFSLKEYGRAVLHFEKAKKLSPRDADIAHNLKFTRLFLKDRFEIPEPMPLVKWFRDTRNSLSLGELRTFEILAFIFLVGSILVQRLLKNRMEVKFLNPVIAGAVILFVFSSGWLIDRSGTEKETHAVVLIEEIEVRSAPVNGSSTLFVIHEGTSGQILNTTDSWYEIRLPDGKAGWLPHETVGTY